MIHRNSLMLPAILLAASISGCTSMGTTVRSQSPQLVNDYHHPSHHQPIGAISDGLQDVYHEHHNTTTSYYHGESAMPGYGGGGGAYCPPPGSNGAYCPPGGGYGGGHDFGIHNGFSYSYERPNDLVYPPSQIGGVVQYPYYTHRGPSDFFRK